MFCGMPKNVIETKELLHSNDTILPFASLLWQFEAGERGKKALGERCFNLNGLKTISSPHGKLFLY